MPLYVLTYDGQYSDKPPAKAAVQGALKILEGAGVKIDGMTASHDRRRYSPVELTAEQTGKLDKGLSGSQGFYMEGPFWEPKAADSFWKNGSED